MTERRSRWRLAVALLVGLGIGLLVATLFADGGTRRHTPPSVAKPQTKPGAHAIERLQEPGATGADNGTVNTTPAANVAGAVAAAQQYSQTFTVGRRAYGYRVLSSHPGRVLVEMVSPDPANGCVRWWVIDAPVLEQGGAWQVNGPWLTLDPCNTPPPPLTDYKRWPAS